MIAFLLECVLCVCLVSYIFLILVVAIFDGIFCYRFLSSGTIKVTTLRILGDGKIEKKKKNGKIETSGYKNRTYVWKIRFMKEKDDAYLVSLNNRLWLSIDRDMVDDDMIHRITKFVETK